MEAALYYPQNGPPLFATAYKLVFVQLLSRPESSAAARVRGFFVYGPHISDSLLRDRRFGS